MSKVDLNVVEAIRMAKVVLDPLRQVLDRRHAAQEIVPVPGLWAFLVSAHVASMSVQVDLDLCPIFFFFFFFFRFFALFWAPPFAFGGS